MLVEGVEVVAWNKFQSKRFEAITLHFESCSLLPSKPRSSRSKDTSYQETADIALQAFYLRRWRFLENRGRKASRSIGSRRRNGGKRDDRRDTKLGKRKRVVSKQGCTEWSIKWVTKFCIFFHKKLVPLQFPYMQMINSIQISGITEWLTL